MTSPEDAATVDQHVGNAVATLYPGDMVGRYLLVAETIDPENGLRGVVCVTSDDAMPWDTMGLAEFALARERAAVARVDGDND